jgi:ligand-binding SRPBCC domain-containing protein
MKIKITTPVNRNFREVFALFNLKLFEALKPPVVNLKVERFDGCKKGDEVHLIVAGQRWVSHITDYVENDDEIYFIDRGVIIPAPLNSWLHIHRIERSGENFCNVIDDIEYSTGNIFTDRLIYPAIYAMFVMRKSIYQRELS